MLIFMFLFAGVVVAGFLAMAVFYGGSRRSPVVKRPPVIKGHVSSRP